MANEAIRWYPSKIDTWLAGVLCIPPCSSIAVTIALYRAERWSEIWVGVASIAGVIALYVGVILPMRYGLGNGQLVVRFGLCRRKIPYERITSVMRTSNPLSSPALSLDRLQIEFGGGIWNSIMISPADRERFLDDLAAEAGLERRADGSLVRTSSR